MRKYFYFLFLICGLLAGSKSYGAISIDSAVAHRSLCSNNGYIDIYATSSSNPVLYGIKSGPVTRALQNSQRLDALPPGTYTVMAVNFAGDTALATTTVSGNYKFPDFTLTFKNPLCPGSGIIVGKTLAGTGLKPYKWELTNNNNGAVVTQLTDTFTGLNAGSYSLRMYDSCLSYSTKGVTLLSTYKPFTSLGTEYTITNCDTLKFRFYLALDGNTPPLPLNARIQVGSKIFYDGPINVIHTGSIYRVNGILPGVKYGDTVSYVFTDACGSTLSYKGRVGPFYFILNDLVESTRNCVRSYIANMVLVAPGRYFDSLGIVYTIRDLSTNTLVDSGITMGSLNSAPLKPGTNYKFVFKDRCGNVDSSILTTPRADPPKMTRLMGNEPSHCVDSTANIVLSASGFSSTPTLTFLSGPTSIHSTKRPFQYSAPIDFYNKNYQPLGSGIYVFSNLATGWYRYKVTDSCGNSVIDSFFITPQIINADFYNFSVIKGCVGASKMAVSFSDKTNGTGDAGSLYVRNLTTGAQVLNGANLRYKTKDTLYNLDYGTYAIRIQRFTNDGAVSASSQLKCQTLYDTLTISPYTPPVINYVTVLKCNGQLVVILNPDSTHGVVPYRYEVVRGPEIFPLQKPNVFTFSQKGSYTARIIDTCDNAQTYFFAVDTVTKPRITVGGTPCFGSNIKLIGERSPYFSYIWVRPNGTYYEGDSLNIAPITPSDTGTYNIIRINHINNCVDSTLTTYLLTGSLQTTINRTICGSQTVVFNGHTYNTTGTYSDTIPTQFCDSIVTLNLTVVDHLEDSASRTICFGESVTIGNHTYDRTGVYRDTFATTYCDSIFILKLGVTPWLTDTSTQKICDGQSIRVGIHTYSQTGIYTDTLVNGNCYSIHTLDLSVNSIKYDSVSKQICSGQSVVVGNHTYTKTGIYRDTLSTADCDSIVVLNLAVSSFVVTPIGRTICAGQSITVGNHTYDQTGIYRDTLSTSNCDSIVILNLSVMPTPLTSLTQTICAGQSITIGNHTYNVSGNYRDTIATPGCDSIVALTLSISGGIDSINRSICDGEVFTWGKQVYSESGIYRDTINTGECDSIRVVNLRVMPVPVVTAGSDKDSITEGATVLLSASPANLKYQWQPAELLDNAYLQNPVASPQNSVWFIVVATDSVSTCSGTDSVFVKVGKPDNRDCDKVGIPSGFTPNNDNHNDFFEVIWLCPVQRFEVRIFNRWGQKIFESQDANFKWDGTYAGEPQPSGTYMYYLKASTASQKQLDFNGNITLIR